MMAWLDYKLRARFYFELLAAALPTAPAFACSDLTRWFGRRNPVMAPTTFLFLVIPKYISYIHGYNLSYNFS